MDQGCPFNNEKGYNRNDKKYLRSGEQLKWVEDIDEQILYVETHKIHV